MLGETDFFDEFSGSKHDGVATVLLAAYLVILTIMMLNLLVAVLSTAHTKVEQNADQEYKVSRSGVLNAAGKPRHATKGSTSHESQALTGVGLWGNQRGQGGVRVGVEHRRWFFFVS